MGRYGALLFLGLAIIAASPPRCYNAGKRGVATVKLGLVVFASLFAASLPLAADAVPVTTVAQTAAPVMPSATATVCPTPNRAATVVHLAAPLYPRGYYSSKPVTVAVQVTIGPDGTITGGHVAQSSGVTAFDASAVQSVEESTFAPKLVNCKPVEGTYLFRVTFRSH